MEPLLQGEDNAETDLYNEVTTVSYKDMSSIQKHLSLHLLMHGLHHSHAERKCHVYRALEQGISFD